MSLATALVGKSTAEVFSALAEHFDMDDLGHLADMIIAELEEQESGEEEEE